jgi:DNA-binding PucR family transcriptional regulator
LADALADMLGGPVIIEDPKFRVLAYSSFVGTVDHGRDAAILGRQIPDEWLRHLEQAGALNVLLTSAQVVDLSNGPWQARRRLLSSIRTDGQLLGVLWLAEGDTPLGSDVTQRMQLAATIAVPHLSRHREIYLQERRRRAQLLRTLLEGGTLPHPFIEELGLLPATSYLLLAARKADDAPLSLIARDRLVDSITLYCQAYRWRTAVAAIGQTVYCVVSLDDEHHEGNIAHLVDGVLSNCLRTLGHNLHAATSSASATLQFVERMRHETDQVLHLLAKHDHNGSPRVLTYHAAMPEIMVDHLADVLRNDPRSHFAKLSTLMAHDERTGSEYTRTLAVFLDRFSNVSVAAAALRLHVSTLRYRLRRLVEISGLDLDSPDERILCQLLLRNT